MVKKFVLVLGAAFVLTGILGFIPALTPNGQLLSLFEVDTVQNIVHLLSGVVAIAAALGGYARLSAQAFGVVYGVVAVLGFLGGAGSEILGLFPVNTAGNFLHLAIALAALYAGFTPEPRRSHA